MTLPTESPCRLLTEASSAISRCTVNVTDVEETGKVTWAIDPDGTNGTNVPAGVVLRQFQPGAVLTASVTDPDVVANGDITGANFKWYRSGTEISGQTEASYTVTDSDVGRNIRVTATYSDSSGPEESVSLTSVASVQAASQANKAPAFASSTVTRRVAENSTGNIGGPVVATDADGDTLTYAIAGTDGSLFRIDPATGQLMVGPDLMIDYEDAVNLDDIYTVEVTAYDSSGAPTAPVATVTINVVDEDEKPTFKTEATGPTENITRAVFVENTTVLNFADYTATDPDDDVVSLSLMGDDAGLFKLAPDTDTMNGAAQELSFKKSPDFEMPGDRNQDNVYEVTVRASAGTLSADRMVTVKVTNVDEDGKVTVSPETALIGVELTATLDDPEGSVAASGQITGERWTWLSGTAANFEADNGGTPIANATSSTYTPVSGNEYLRAMVSYVYQFEIETDADAEDRKTGVSAVIPVQTSRENQAPKFKDGSSTFRVVAEDVVGIADDASDSDSDSDNIGSPVEATDANADMLTYTLSGPDASRFSVRANNGQLEVKAGGQSGPRDECQSHGDAHGR